tara:strand:+ start:604 stop:1146 length:543 start_codon:yes stop_codon:yes gene_type:complete
MAKADFDALVARAMAMPGRAHMRPVIEKELLHYDMLFALDQGGLLDRITFQGGTSLRLCHGSPRFSEDLDFAGGPDFKSEDLIAIKGCLEEYLGARYDLQVSVKEPREMAVDRAERGLNVDCWQVSIQTAPARPDLPRQRTLLREGFLDYLIKQVKGHLENALTALRTPAGTKAEPPFRM